MRQALAIVLAAGLLSGSVAAAERGKTVRVTGRAVGTAPSAAEEARLDALRTAVQQVCGSFINAQSEVENFVLVRDKILEQPVGFARLVKVVKGPEVVSNAFTQVEIEAEVFPAAFEKRWAEFAHILVREGNPRCVIVVLEDDNPLDTVVPVTNGLVQTELEGFFLSKKVRLMDREAANAVRKRDLQLAAESGDLKKAAAAGAAFKADVVLLGNAEAREGDSVNIGGIWVKRWNVTLAIRAIQTDSAALLMSKTYRPKKALTTTTGSGKDALTRVAKDAAAEVLGDVAQAWRERATVGKTIEVTLAPCTRQQFKAIQAEMVKLKGVTGGEEGFRLRELANEVVNAEVDWKYDLNQLADRIEELSVPAGEQTLVFEVAEQSANRLSIVVKAHPTAGLIRPAAQTRPATQGA